jgi:hypothetical protein
MTKAQATFVERELGNLNDLEVADADANDDR